MKQRPLFITLVVVMTGIGFSVCAHGQLSGGSGLVGTVGNSLLGGSSLGNAGSLLSPGGNSVSGLLGGLTGTVGSVLNTTQTVLTSSVNSAPVLRSTSARFNLLTGISLLSGFDTFNSSDSSSLLSRFETLGFPGSSSAYSFGSQGSLTPGWDLMNLSSPSTAIIFSWTPAGYVSSSSSPTLRAPGALGTAPLRPSAAGAKTSHEPH